jgi:hypothetical protein
MASFSEILGHADTIVFVCLNLLAHESFTAAERVGDARRLGVAVSNLCTVRALDVDVTILSVVGRDDDMTTGVTPRTARTLGTLEQGC